MDIIDGALSPLKPALQAITQNLPKPVNDLAASFLGSQCQTTLMHNIDFSSGNLPCINLALSKALGVVIISVAAIVKVPQLLKLLSSESAAGVSFLSVLLETASYTITLAYSVRREFPFSTYGETAFVAVQDLVIALLILVYSGKTTWGLSFLVGAASVTYALFSPALVDMDNLTYLQAGAGLLGVASKVPQIITIWAEGGTGQLSAFAVFNYLAGSLARIFTTLQEVDDKLILYGFISGFILNAITAAQMVYYWNSPTKAHTAEPTITVGSQNEKPGTAAGSSVSTPASPAKSSGASTRRRG